MYLGIDFLVGPDFAPRVVEVNVGLPGGAQEYELTRLVRTGRPSGVFDRIEGLSRAAYGRPFREHLANLPWLGPLKVLKLWLDGEGPFPSTLHPGLRLEDKWVQCGVLRGLAPMPETMIYDPADRTAAERFLARVGKAVCKRRLGRGGRGFTPVDGTDGLPASFRPEYGALLQERVDSRIGPWTFSIRSVAFAGHPVCLYANLAERPHSNHGLLAAVEAGDRLGLDGDVGRTERFDRRSWEAGIWFGDDEPAYLRHNLREDEVTAAALVVPAELLTAIEDLSVRIERRYDGLRPETLPPALFEEPGWPGASRS